MRKNPYIPKSSSSLSSKEKDPSQISARWRHTLTEENESAKLLNTPDKNISWHGNTSKSSTSGNKNNEKLLSSTGISSARSSLQCEKQSNDTSKQVLERGSFDKSKPHDNIFERMSLFGNLESVKKNPEKKPAKKRGRPPGTGRSPGRPPKNTKNVNIKTSSKSSQINDNLKEKLDCVRYPHENGSVSSVNNSDNEHLARLDHMESNHGTPDSGIGNESPNSVNLHLHLDRHLDSHNVHPSVTEPLSIPTSALTSSTCEMKSPSSYTCKMSVSPGRHRIGMGASPSSSVSSIYTESLNKHKDFHMDTSGCESELNDCNMLELGITTSFPVSSSPSNSSPSSSPGKKKRRGRLPKKHEFLLKHKSSNLLKTGQMPTHGVQTVNTNNMSHIIESNVDSVLKDLSRTLYSFNDDPLPDQSVSPSKKVKLDSSCSSSHLLTDQLPLTHETPVTHDAIHDIIIKHKKGPKLPKVKRPPGRPPLVSKTVNILKRGPGRPPLNPINIKRGRGRPPIKKMKRGPGRPPKKLLLDQIIVKRSPGRPKGSKNKVKKAIKCMQNAAAVSKAKKQTNSMFVGGASMKNAAMGLGRDQSSLVSNQFVKIQSSSISDSESDSMPSAPTHSSSTDYVIVVSSLPSPSRDSPVLQEQAPLEKFTKVKRGPGRPRKIPDTSSEKSAKHAAFVEKRKKTDTNEFDSLIQSVNDSIKSQFLSQNEIIEDSESKIGEDLESIEPTLDPASVTLSPVKEESQKPVPKIRKPKLHVMMRKPKKRGRKKKLNQNGSSSVVSVPTTNNFLGKYSALAAKFKLKSARTALGFTERSTCSKFTSHSSSESNTSSIRISCGSATSPSRDYLRRIQMHSKFKKKKLLNFRSKHKNIVDPMFLSDMEQVVETFPNLSISAQGETFIRVKPGEVPLPSIFKLHKINVKVKKREPNVFDFEKDRSKKHDKAKHRKDQFEFIEKWLAKEKWKGVKKTKPSEDLSSTNLGNLSKNSSQQCLPPKKRHKMFSSESGKGMDEQDGDESASDSDGEKFFIPKPVVEKRKVGRPRKRPLPTGDVSFTGLYIYICFLSIFNRIIGNYL